MKYFLRKSLYIIALLIICTLLSCRKYGHGYIEGTVYEKGTNIPIKGAKVYLHSNHNDGIDKPSKEKLDSTTTDANGNYKFYF